MKRIMYVLFIGLISFLPAAGVAQEKIAAESSQKSQITPAKTTDPKGVLSELQPDLKVAPPEANKTSKEKNGLYHIIVISEDQKKQSIWVEVDHGEQKYVTIRLDNGTTQDVLIQLENEPPALKTLMRSPNGLSSLTLQPISF